MPKLRINDAGTNKMLMKQCTRSVMRLRLYTISDKQRMDGMKNCIIETIGSRRDRL